MLARLSALSSSKGETIIEVTMAIAILATTVVMAYATANTSTHIGVQAKEHIQAVHLAAQQADRLKAKRDADMVALPTIASGNILGVGSTYGPCAIATGPKCYINSSLIASAAGATGQPCPAAVFPAGTNCHVWFERDPSNNSGNSKTHFTTHVTWDSQNGNQTNTVAIDVILVDKRDFKPQDCSEADACTP
jgi:hypothetical protein